MSPLFILALLVASLALPVQAEVPPTHPEAPAVEERDEVLDPAPARSIEAGLPSLTDYRGRVVVLHFWATWCRPCRTELVSLRRFHEEAYAALRERGVEVITVSNDVRERDLTSFLAESPLPFPVYFDPYHRLRDAVRLAGVPSTAVVDRDGNVKARLYGAQDWQGEALRTHIEACLAAPEDRP